MVYRKHGSSLYRALCSKHVRTNTIIFFLSLPDIAIATPLSFPALFSFPPHSASFALYLCKAR